MIVPGGGACWWGRVLLKQAGCSSDATRLLLVHYWFFCMSLSPSQPVGVTSEVAGIQFRFQAPA
eukprot:3115179-Rhodomonas_salina.1